MTKIQNRKNHYIEILLPFYLMLSQYSFGSISIGLIALALVAFFYIRLDGYKILFPAKAKPFLFFLLYVIVRDVFRAIIGTDSVQTQINRMLAYILPFILSVIVSNYDFDENKLYKVWKIAGLLYILGIIYHVLQIYVLHQSIAPISIIPGYILRSEELVAQYRPCSFFAEPAAFVGAVLPLEFLALKRQDIRTAVFVTIGILLSTSTVGTVLSGALWILFLINYTITLGRKILIVAVSVVVIILFVNLSIFSASYSKLLSVSSGGSTFDSRVLTGFEVVKSLDPINFVFGTNYNEIGSYMRDYSSRFSNSSFVLISYYRNSGLFLNTFGQLFFKYGLIGALIFYWTYIRYAKNKKYVARIYVAIMIIATFAQSSLLNVPYFQNMMIILLYDGAIFEDAQIENKFGGYN